MNRSPASGGSDTLDYMPLAAGETQGGGRPSLLRGGDPNATSAASPREQPDAQGFWTPRYLSCDCPGSCIFLSVRPGTRIFPLVGATSTREFIIS